MGGLACEALKISTKVPACSLVRGVRQLSERPERPNAASLKGEQRDHFLTIFGF